MIWINFNLPTWLEAKPFFPILSLIIMGKNIMTSNTNGIYLKPLYDEIIELWI